MANDKPKKWIQAALPKSSKGGLHKSLGVPEGKKISQKQLARAENSASPKVRKQAALARTLARLR